MSRPRAEDPTLERGRLTHRRRRPPADATQLLARWQAGGIDAVTVTSAETLHNLAALLGEAVVLACWRFTPLSFLWWNLIGCVLTVALAAAFSRVFTADVK